MRQKTYISIFSLLICGVFIGLHFYFEDNGNAPGGRTPSSYRSPDYTQSIIDRQYITLKDQTPVGNPELIHQKEDDEDYLKRLFGLIIQKADGLARDDWYLPDVPSRNYFTFLLGSLTVPYHESYFVHIRQRSNDEQGETLCEQSANGVKGYQEIKNHFSRLGQEFTDNIVECSQLRRSDSPYQLVASGNHSDVGLMQINFKVHKEHFRSQKIFNLQKTLSYGLDYYYKGFTRYAHSFDSIGDLKKNLQRRSCLFPKEARAALMNLKNPSEENLRSYMNQNLLNPKALLYSGWSGYYNSGPAGKACRFAESLQCLQAMKKENKFAWFHFLKRKRDLFEKMAEDYAYLGEAPSYKREYCPWWENDVKLVKDFRDFSLRGSDHFHTYLPYDSIEVKALNEILDNLKNGTHETKYLDIVRDTNYRSESIEYPSRASDNVQGNQPTQDDSSDQLARNDSNTNQNVPQEPNTRDDEPRIANNTDDGANDQQDEPQTEPRNDSQDEPQVDEDEPQQRNPHPPSADDQSTVADNSTSIQDQQGDQDHSQDDQQSQSGMDQDSDDLQVQSTPKYNYYIVVNRSNIRPQPTRHSTVCGNMRFADQYPLKVILYTDSIENHYYKIDAKNVRETIFRPNHPDCRGRKSFYVHLNLVKRIPKELDTFDIASSDDSLSGDNTVSNQSPASSTSRSPAKRATARTWIWLRDAFGISRSQEIKMLNPETVFQVLKRKVLYDSDRNGYVWYKILHPEGEIYYVYSGEEGSADQYIKFID